MASCHTPTTPPATRLFLITLASYSPAPPPSPNSLTHPLPMLLLFSLLLLILFILLHLLNMLLLVLLFLLFLLFAIMSLLHQLSPHSYASLALPSPYTTITDPCSLHPYYSGLSLCIFLVLLVPPASPYTSLSLLLFL